MSSPLPPSPSSASSVIQFMQKLRFQQYAETYRDNLARAGFDDIQSICEDAELADFHAAGMLPGHARRLLKACRLAVNHHSVHASSDFAAIQNFTHLGSTGRSSNSGGSGDSTSSSLVSLSCPECAHQFTMNFIPRPSSLSSTGGRTMTPSPSPPERKIQSSQREDNYDHREDNVHGEDSVHSVETDLDFDNFNSNESSPPPPDETHPSLWPISSVLRWLRAIPPLRTTQTLSLCVSNKIVGKDLLNLSVERICELLGVAFGPHKRVLKREIMSLRGVDTEAAENNDYADVASTKSISPTERVARVCKNERLSSVGVRLSEDARQSDGRQEEEELSIASGLNDDDSVLKNPRRAKVFSRGAARHLNPSFAPPLLKLGESVDSGESDDHSEGERRVIGKERPSALRIEMDSDYDSFNDLTPQSSTEVNGAINKVDVISNDRVEVERERGERKLRKTKHDKSWEMSDGGTLLVDGFTVKPSGISDLQMTKGATMGTIPELERTQSVNSRGSSRGVVRGTVGGLRGNDPPRSITPPSARPTNTKTSIITLREVGRGACGVVHEALHIPTMKLVAVKSVTVNNGEKRRQMLRELKIMHGMCGCDIMDDGDDEGEGEDDSREGKHPYIVSFYDAFTDPERGTVQMVLEYMNAGTLQDLINAGISVTERMIASVARCVLRGLEDVHRSKQIHRDIKPSNILLSRDGNIKISDFGIARKLEHSISMASTFTGTLTYMSPERISGESYDTKCDIWSLGVCLCTLAKGKYPFTTNEGYWGVVQAIQEEATPKVGGNYGEDFQEFLDICLQKDPKMRWGCKELLEHRFLKRFEKEALNEHQPPQASPKRVKAVNELAKKVMSYHVERLAKGEVLSIPEQTPKLLSVLAKQLGMPAEVLVEIFSTEYEIAFGKQTKSEGRGDFGMHKAVVNGEHLNSAKVLNLNATGVVTKKSKVKPPKQLVPGPKLIPEANLAPVKPPPQGRAKSMRLPATSAPISTSTAVSTSSKISSKNRYINIALGE